MYDRGTGSVGGGGLGALQRRVRTKVQKKVRVQLGAATVLPSTALKATGVDGLRQQLGCSDQSMLHEPSWNHRHCMSCSTNALSQGYKSGNYSHHHERERMVATRATESDKESGSQTAEHPGYVHNEEGIRHALDSV